MFDLDQQISLWRETMARGGISDPLVLDELESHLRDYVEQRVRSGDDIAAAFKVGMERMGEVHELRQEFLRAGPQLSLSRLRAVLDDHRKCFWISLVVAALVSLGFYWSWGRLTPLYQAEATLQLLRAPVPSVASQVSAIEGDVHSAERLNDLMRRFVSVRLRTEVVNSLTPSEKLIARRAADSEPRDDHLLGRLTVSSLRRSSIVTVSVIHKDPAAAALIANRFVDLCLMDLRKESNAFELPFRVVAQASPPRSPVVPNLSTRLRDTISVGIILLAVLMGITEVLRKAGNSVFVAAFIASMVLFLLARHFQGSFILLFGMLTWPSYLVGAAFLFLTKWQFDPARYNIASLSVLAVFFCGFSAYVWSLLISLLSRRHGPPSRTVEPPKRAA